MKQFVTQGIVPTRTDYGEADRILTIITPDEGKLKAIAKGVRRSQSKLAGGIELFSVSNITLIAGRKDINTLISTRLVKHYGNIVKDIHRTNAAYEAMRLINKATEDQPEPAYFELLKNALEALNNFEIPLDLTVLWFNMQLLKLAGHTPNLRTDLEGKKLLETKKYNFDLERMGFFTADRGRFNAKQIKFLRLGFGNNLPKALNRINDLPALIKSTELLCRTMLQTRIPT